MLFLGIGCRKCLGIKLATSQIKLFIVKLLQNYYIDNPKIENGKSSSTTELNEFNLFNSVETKDVLFSSQTYDVNVSIERLK